MALKFLAPNEEAQDNAPQHRALARFFGAGPKAGASRLVPRSKCGFRTGYMRTPTDLQRAAPRGRLQVNAL